MAENTRIEWADMTFNPWVGCTKVSPGCDHCYAEAYAARFGTAEWGAGKPRHRTSAAYWKQPRKWNAQAEHEGRRFRVFCSSLADVFDNEVPPAWREDLFRLIEQTPNLDWLLLTKRIGNVSAMVSVIPGSGWMPPNVWLGATVTSQEEADRDIPKLLAVPAAKWFLSMEPLLGPVDIRFAFADSRTSCCRRCGYRTNRRESACPNDGELLRVDIGIDWVIVGGESGPQARPMQIVWAMDLVRQCQAAGIPAFMKQLGAQPRGWCVGALHADDQTEIGADYCDAHESHEGTACERCVLLTDRKGGDMTEWPEELRVREVPR